jgi:hypothetical protein
MNSEIKDRRGTFAVRAALAAVVVGSLAACGTLPDPVTEESSALVSFNPRDFSTSVANPFFPLVPGTTYTFQVTLDTTSDQVITEITHQTRRILGVDTIVIHDRSLLKGKVVEDTLDFVKGDRFGNVRYFGEDTKELDENGSVVSTSGSFIAGTQGAAGPQILMEAQPKVGDVYFEEFAPKDEAEDQAEVTSLNKSISVPISLRALHGCVETHNFTQLEPDSKERKVYCRDFGVVVTDAIKGDPKHEALVSITHD